MSQRGRNRSVSGLERDGRVVTIAFKVLTRRLLRWRTRYDRDIALMSTADDLTN
ncbi:hypothetical protein FC13_GL001382 [Lacticaseibacillus casei DSM 20011 = JCM 1134 = ATCC 393]|nr:hypothetical protein Lpp17_2477 [Lacticaseibacillus paracasei subsp. paracasei Lpp17]KRK17817.1 hypothetical protein FC13_GL001382 [Lacticaseibacillus casei DSM 20011 = JCM 1134 = ATCC 393]